MSMLRLWSTFVSINTPEQAEDFLKNFDSSEKVLLLAALTKDISNWSQTVVNTTTQTLFSNVSETNANKESVETFQSSLYADTIDTSVTPNCFNKVSETPNNEVFFELVCTSPTQANITIYPPAYEVILARPEFIDCTNVHPIGHDKVIIKEMWIAQKLPNGKRMVTKKPEIILAYHWYEL